MLAHLYNPSTEEAEAEELRIPSQHGLHSKALYQKRNKVKK
jgi:hypothetical protein